MNTVDVYVAYVYMRRHVTTKAIYDRFRMKSLRNAEQLVQKDKYFKHFVAITRVNDPRAYIVGNLIYTGGYIAEFREENFARYQNFQCNVFPFRKELEKLQLPLNQLMSSVDDNPPPLLQMLIDGKIDWMAVLIINTLLNFHVKWKTQAFVQQNKKMTKLVHKLEKLASLIELKSDSDKYRMVILDHFERLQKQNA